MIAKTYNEAIDYLYETLPMYQRVGAVAYRNDLSNTIALCEALGNPQNQLKFVHVAGTNGKGSTSHMLAAILQSAGYRTGLYTSPHLKEFTERIKVNGAEITQQAVVDFVNRTSSVMEKIKPSFFEMTVAMAFDYFLQEEIDIAVIEVGLGGRLDATNVITPELSVITNISFDHKDILGDTLVKIAGEKAGIIKGNVPLVVSERQPEVEHVFIDKATSSKAPMVFGSDIITLKKDGEAVDVFHHGAPWMNHLVPELKGSYQLRNIPGVLATILELNEVGFRVSDDDIRSGIEHTVELTGLKGRWQILQRNPLVICDTGHNEGGIQLVVDQIQATPHHHLHFIMGVVKEKDPAPVLKLLPTAATYYFCQAAIPRAMDADQLANEGVSVGLKGMVVRDVNEALKTALANADPDDLIFIGGSTFVVAEINGL